MKHFAAHDVIYIDFSRLPYVGCTYSDYINAITGGIKSDIQELFPDLHLSVNEFDLFGALNDAYSVRGARFCFVMDEWDSMFYNKKFTKDDQDSFLMFLKQLLKDKPYVEIAYMTGVLPIAKYSSGSELNMFIEYNAISDPKFDKYFGFTVDEVKQLCARHAQVCAKEGEENRLEYEDLEFWYDGYFALDGTRRFNPRSVVSALGDNYLRDYWTSSGPRDEIFNYIKHNVDDVRDDVVRMVAGDSVRTEADCYAASDMSLNTREEILSAMVVYGFLTYYKGCVSIPNHELMIKFQRVLKKKEIGRAHV